MNTRDSSFFTRLFRMQKGITVVELLLVVAIVSILGAATAPIASRFMITAQFESATNLVRSTLEKAQLYSMAGKSDSSWGVCLFNSTTIRLFTGTCEAPTFAENSAISQSITITGLAPVMFSKQRGEPSSANTITVSSSLNTATITLNIAGGISMSGNSPSGPVGTPTPTTVPVTTPTSTPTATPTPTIVPTSCTIYCQQIGFTAGVCRRNTNLCTSNGETYQPGGDLYCPAAGDPGNARRCCCQN